MTYFVLFVETVSLNLFTCECCLAFKQSGMLSHHGHGMPKMKPVGFVGWHLMVVVLIVNSLEMIAH